MESKGLKGVVSRVGRRAVWVATEDEGEVEGKRVWVVGLANEGTYKR